MTDYDELARLAREATPGPWHTGDDSATRNGVWADVVTAAEDEEGISGYLVAWCHSDWRDDQDAAYIAAASPDVILALLEERRVLREALLHVTMRRHEHADGCDGCLNVQRQARAALQAEPARAEEGART